MPQPPSGACPYCWPLFRPRRRGHVFCSNFCPYRGERPVEEREEIDTEAVKRLFDPSRDPEELVRDDDWFPGPSDAEWRSLYASETVGGRRRWYMNLWMEGEL